MRSIYKSLTQNFFKSHWVYAKNLNFSIFNNYEEQFKRFTFISIIFQYEL